MPPEKKKIPSKWNNAVIAHFLSNESKLITVDGKKNQNGQKGIDFKLYKQSR